MKKFPLKILFYLPLAYLLFLLPFHLYEPSRTFNLPNILWLTHLILLYIHEAGHVLFSIFGRTIMLLGGSLMQVLAPLIWFFVAKNEKSKLEYVALFFTGVSITDVSVYVKDAGMLQLPLLGGLSKTHHDWANLFNEWRCIEYSYMLGEMLFWFGFLLAFYSLSMSVRREIIHQR